MEIISWGRWRIAWVTPSNVREVNESLKEGLIDGIGLNPHCGFTGDWELLASFQRLPGLVVTDAEDLNFARLEACQHLQFLSLGGERAAGVDFRSFLKLVDLRVSWNKDDVLPLASGPLESLYLKGVKPKNKDLGFIPSYMNLTSLEVVQGEIVSLSGIEKLSKLVSIDLSFCRKLESIGALANTNIELLHVEACGKVADWAQLAGCPALRSIRLSSCGDLPSLSFLNDISSLEEFRFVKMNVVDGDMTPLLRLNSVGFIDKRHFSHSRAEVEAFIANRRQTK